MHARRVRRACGQVRGHQPEELGARTHAIQAMANDGTDQLLPAEARGRRAREGERGERRERQLRRVREPEEERGEWRERQVRRVRQVQRGNTRTNSKENKESGADAKCDAYARCTVTRAPTRRRTRRAVRTPSATRTPGAREHEHQHEPDQGLQGPLHQHCLYQVCYTPRAKHEVTKYHTRQGRGQDAVPQAAAPRQRRGAPVAAHHEQLAGQLQRLGLEGRAWTVQVNNLDRRPLHQSSGSQYNCNHCPGSEERPAQGGEWNLRLGGANHAEAWEATQSSGTLVAATV